MTTPMPARRWTPWLNGPEKKAAKANLPEFPPAECAGDGKNDFKLVNNAIDAAKASGDNALVHCHASSSRSPNFILAHMTQDRMITLVEAVKQMRISGTQHGRTTAS